MAQSNSRKESNAIYQHMYNTSNELNFKNRFQELGDLEDLEREGRRMQNILLVKNRKENRSDLAKELQNVNDCNEGTRCRKSRLAGNYKISSFNK